MSLLYPDSTHMQTLLDEVNKRRVVRGVAEWLMPPGPSRAHIVAIRDWMKSQLDSSESEPQYTWRWVDTSAVGDAGGIASWLDVNVGEGVGGFSGGQMSRMWLPALKWDVALFNRLGIGREVDGEPRLTGETDAGVITRWNIHSLYDELLIVLGEMNTACVPPADMRAKADENTWDATMYVTVGQGTSETSLADAQSDAESKAGDSVGVDDVADPEVAFAANENDEDPYRARFEYPVLHNLNDKSGWTEDRAPGATFRYFVRAVKVQTLYGTNEYHSQGVWADSEHEWKELTVDAEAWRIDYRATGLSPVYWGAAIDSIHGGSVDSRHFVIEFDFADPEE